MPGLIVCELLPPRLTAPRFVIPVGLGPTKPANGSGRGLDRWTTPGMKLVLGDLPMPPTASMSEACTWPLPLRAMALAELESTTTAPPTLMLAPPDMLSAPDALGSRTMMERPTTVAVLVNLTVVDGPWFIVTVTVKVPAWL